MKHFRPLLIPLAAIALAVSCGPDIKQDNSGDEPWQWGSGSGSGSTDPVDPGVKFYPKPSGSLRIVTYNIGAFSKYLGNSTDMVAAMMKEIEADAIGLNELDSCNTRHNTNQVAALANALGNWQSRFGKAMDYRNGGYGNGVVTPKSMKIVDSYTVTLAKGSGSEQRSICVVETDKYVIGAAHLDHTSQDASTAQALAVNAWASSRYRDCEKPVFFVGDMNSEPGSQTISALKGAWDVLSATDNTYPSTAPVKCIDYIFHYKNSKAVKVTGSNVAVKFHTGEVNKASDHCPVYCDVQF